MKRMENYRKKPRFDAPIYAKIKADKDRTLSQRAEAEAARRTPAGILTRAFGVFGLVLYYLLILAIAYAPLLFLGFPWWANILAVLGIMFIPFIGGLAQLILWIWGFLLVVKLPVSLTVVLFYIGAALYVPFVLIPGILSHFGIDLY